MIKSIQGLENKLKGETVKEIKAPSTMDDYDQYSDSLFVAGDISNCPDWQREFVQSLKHTEIKCYNLRRDTYA